MEQPRMHFSAILLITMISMATGHSHAQPTAEVVAKYKNAIAGIKTMSYDVHRVDKFHDGNGSDKNGKCILQRTDSLPGFNFYGVRNDVASSFISHGKYIYQLSSGTKEYARSPFNINLLMSSPGGQMLVTDLLKADSVYETVSHTVQDDSYIIKYTFRDNPQYEISDFYKLVYIDKKTFIPFKTETYSTSGKQKGFTIKEISNLKINDVSKMTKDALDISKQLNGFSQHVEKKEADITGLRAFDFTLPDFNNNEVSLESLKGKYVLLDFWEVWCGPCVGSMPKIQAFHEKFGEKGLIVLGIITDPKNLEKSKDLIQRKGITYKNLLGNSELGKKYAANYIPRYVLIGPDQKIIYTNSGYSNTLEQVITKELSR